MQIIKIFIFIVPASVCFGDPAWIVEPTVKHISGKVIVVTCQGEGLAKDLSFQAAISQCNSIAATEANSEFTSKSVVVETEKEPAKFYSEVSSQKRITGLTPKTESELTETNNGHCTTFLRVKYDLSKAIIVSDKNETTESEDSIQKHSVEVIPQPTLSSGINAKKSRVSADRTITVLMSPEKCRDYLIRGKRPRTYSCSTNPLQIMVSFIDDTEIILRPASAFLPKTIKIHRQFSPTNTYQDEVIDVQFERY